MLHTLKIIIGIINYQNENITRCFFDKGNEENHIRIVRNLPYNWMALLVSSLYVTVIQH